MSAAPPDALAQEAAERPRAGIAAILAGLLTLAGGVLYQLVLRNGPGIEEYVGVLDALDTTVQGRPPGESLLVQQVDYVGDRVVPLMLSTLLSAVGVALAAYALLHLFKAVRNRAPNVGRGGIIAIVMAGVAYPVGHLVGEGARWIGAAGFGDAETRTAQAARDTLTAPTVAAGQLLEFLGTLALGVAFLLTALNAMRVGLLTRFLGVLGIVVGALVILPLDQPQIVRSLWLVFVGTLILGIGPFRTRPPAWESGNAEPWPSQQEIREARARGGAPARAAEPAPAAAEEPDAQPVAAGAVRAGGQRRKRKRRG